MFDWFKRKSPEGDGFYDPKERKIYRYFDGQTVVQVDPMEIYSALAENWGDISADLSVAAAPMKDSAQAYRNGLIKLRRVFNVKPLGEGGLSDLEVFDLVESFIAYTERLKKNLNDTPTPPTVTSGPFVPFSGAGPPIPSSSDSGSAATAPSSAAPTL